VVKTGRVHGLRNPQTKYICKYCGLPSPLYYQEVFIMVKKKYPLPLPIPAG
jgi:hypothetical protein